jgi:hypothetical protein
MIISKTRELPNTEPNEKAAMQVYLKNQNLLILLKMQRTASEALRQ